MISFAVDTLVRDYVFYIFVWVAICCVCCVSWMNSFISVMPSRSFLVCVCVRGDILFLPCLFVCLFVCLWWRYFRPNYRRLASEIRTLSFRSCLFMVSLQLLWLRTYHRVLWSLAIAAFHSFHFFVLHLFHTTAVAISEVEYWSYEANFYLHHLFP